MEPTETLKDALIRVGDQSELQLLNDQAQNLTKAQVTDFLNNKVDHDLSMGALHGLRKLAKQRIKEGKSVFPWDQMEDVEHNEADDNMGGGTW